MVDERRIPKIDARTEARLANEASGLDRLIGPVLWLSAVLLPFGWSLPLMTVERLFLFTEEVSLLGSIGTLVDEGEWLLALLVLAFTIVTPAAKIALGLWVWYRPIGHGHRRWLGRLEALGRWSMLDVFLVALALAAAKIAWVGDLDLEGGFPCFAAAALLSMAALQRLTRLAARQAEGPSS